MSTTSKDGAVHQVLTLIRRAGEAQMHDEAMKFSQAACNAANAIAALQGLGLFPQAEAEAEAEPTTLTILTNRCGFEAMYANGEFVGAVPKVLASDIRDASRAEAVYVRACAIDLGTAGLEDQWTDDQWPRTLDGLKLALR